MVQGNIPLKKAVRKSSTLNIDSPASLAAEPDSEPPADPQPPPLPEDFESGGSRPSMPGPERGSTFLTDFDEKETEPEPDVPPFIRNQILMENVVKQQQTYQQRMEDWKTQQEHETMQNDLVAFTGAGAASRRSKRPQPFTVDENELKQLISLTFLDWKDGKFKHIEKNRERIMKKAFKTWLRASGVYEEQIISTAMGPMT